MGARLNWTLGTNVLTALNKLLTAAGGCSGSLPFFRLHSPVEKRASASNVWPRRCPLCAAALTAGPTLVKHFGLFGVDQLQLVLDLMVQVRGPTPPPFPCTHRFC